MFFAITYFFILSAILTTILVHRIDCKNNFDSQSSNVNSNEFQLWFINETALTVLWEDHDTSSDVKEYKFHIKPPDSEHNNRHIQSKGEPVLLNFIQLVPGRAYTIVEEVSIAGVVSHESSASYRTTPLPPSFMSIDELSLTTNSFKIAWEPPDCDFDKYEISVTTRDSVVVINKTFDKIKKTDYVVDENVLPGHSYKVNMRTLSVLIPSKPNAVGVTLKPLPVENVTVTSDSKLVWQVDPVSHQDIFYIKMTNEELSEIEEIPADKKEFSLKHLSPGRQYLFQIEAISEGIRSEAIIVYHITPPLPPVLTHVKPIHDGIEVAWQADVDYGQDTFQVVFHRLDIDEKRNISTKNTQAFLSHLYPGAMYSVRVLSVSKYANYSSSAEVTQGVMPLSPRNVTASYVNTTTLSVAWDVTQNSLVSGYSVRYKTEGHATWKQIVCSAKETSPKITDLSSGERYKVQVSSVSHNVESLPVELQWTTPPAPVTHVVPLPSSNSITLKFSRPQSRVDFYNVTWRADGTLTHTELFPDNENNTGQYVLLPIENLVPGVSYMLTVASVSYHMESKVVSLVARTWPLRDSELQVWDSTNSVTINYIPPKMISFDHFRFNLSAVDLSPRTIEKSVYDNNTNVQFDLIVPGKLYDLHIWTVSDEMLSVPTEILYRVHPGIVKELNVTSVTNTSISLAWKVPQGEFSKFEVTYLKSVLETFTTSVNISMLQPYQNYTFWIRTLAGFQDSVPARSAAVVLTVETLESLPEEVNGFHPVEVNAENITFVWSLPPEDQHGVITEFQLLCILGEWSKEIGIPPEKRLFTVTSLKPGRKYLFKIQARTSVGSGPSSVWEQVMPVLAPPQPDDHLFPTSVQQTTSTLQIRFFKSFFSDENGEILYYTIIISEDLHDNSSSMILNLPGWREVQPLHPWPPYQVVFPYQFFSNNTTVVDFTVGEATCVANEQYCNGALKSGTAYKIKVRAFTRRDLFTDTIYSYPISTKQDFTLLFYLAIGFVGVIMLALVLLMRRRRLRKGTDVSLQNRSHPIPAARFQTMLLDSDPSWILSEFESLRLIGKEQTTTAAELGCNRPKNRYSNILPYDHSRCKLQPVDDEEGSDYVNANYTAGHLSPRQYIATQGPLSTTQDDFWRMCWESRTPAIVMLTQCVEKGRDKCLRYWPIGDKVLRCGDIDVRLLQVSHYSGWSISRLRLCRGRESRVIFHFHFTTWPDSGVPQTSEALVRFVTSFRCLVSSDQSPIIVHCSAGVGRTGTFIAVDIIAQSLSKVGLSGSVDVFGVVYQLRKQRMCMVQTVDQYLYIYLCVKLLLRGGTMSRFSESKDLVFLNDAFELDEGVDDL